MLRNGLSSRFLLNDILKEISQKLVVKNQDILPKKFPKQINPINAFDWAIIDIIDIILTTRSTLLALF